MPTVSRLLDGTRGIGGLGFLAGGASRARGWGLGLGFWRPQDEILAVQRLYGRSSSLQSNKVGVSCG